MAEGGLRVLALAYKTLDTAQNAKTLPREEIEQSLTFLGLCGINDPPRPETASAVASCHQAGITVRMLTGDHPKTAAVIARQVGITSLPGRVDESSATIHVDTGGERVWTGPEFDALSDVEVDKLVELPRVVARCTPETKVKMIDALKRRGKIAAMTGDGVNGM